MANNYTFFSEMIEDLTPAAVEWVEMVLALKYPEDLEKLKEELNLASDDPVFIATFACTCSKPSVGEFGGYWLAISKDDVKAGNTWDAAREVAKEMSVVSA